MKILIAGGAGYVGGYLTDLFTDNNHEVTVIDNLLYETRYMKPIRFINGDVRDPKTFNNINEYDIVVWLPAIVGAEACDVNPTLTREVNVNTVKWLVDNYKGKIVFTSTCSVYGINEGMLDETSPTNPISLYGETKLEAEQYITKNHSNHLVFRLGTLFGLGDFFTRLRLDLIVNYLAYKAATEKCLSVFGGEQWRPILHVRDVSRAILFGLQNNIRGVFNLTYANYTIRNVAEKIALAIPNVEIKLTEKEFEDSRNYKINFDKYQNLGWTPIYTVENGAEEIYFIINKKRVVNPHDSVYFNVQHLKKL